MEDLERAKHIALGFLAHRPRTVRETELRLAKAGFDETIIEPVIEQLKSVGYLDDSGFAERWVAERAAGKSLGTRRLANELRQKGVQQDDLEGALASVEPETELDAAAAFAAKRLGNNSLEDANFRRKLSAALQRRGYTWETIEQVFRRLAENHT